MIKLKSKKVNDNVKVDVNAKKPTIVEYFAIIFTVMDEVTEKFDGMNRGKLLNIINNHYDYYNKERRK